MAIELIVKPGPAVGRAEFVSTHPPYSIALDGYVYGEPFLEVNAAGPYRNFNHHEMVDRSCTSATCEQVRRAILLGMFELFCDKGGHRAMVWANDCDQDVCLATWLLFNADRASEPLVRVITQVEDLLDMSAGGLPMPHERDLLAEIRWVFDPYARARPNLVAMTGAQMRGVIDVVHGRIEDFLSGRAGHLPPDGRFTKIGGGEGWALVRVGGAHVREAMVGAGIHAAVELVNEVGDRFVYTVWRRSEYIVRFPVRAILQALNVAEGLTPDDGAGWGGSENVGGSPRGRGSALPPPVVERVVKSVLARPLQP